MSHDLQNGEREFGVGLNVVLAERSPKTSTCPMKVNIKSHLVVEFLKQTIFKQSLFKLFKLQVPFCSPIVRKAIFPRCLHEAIQKLDTRNKAKCVVYRVQRLYLSCTKAFAHVGLCLQTLRTDVFKWLPEGLVET